MQWHCHWHASQVNVETILSQCVGKMVRPTETSVSWDSVPRCAKLAMENAHARTNPVLFQSRKSLNKKFHLRYLYWTEFGLQFVEKMATLTATSGSLVAMMWRNNVRENVHVMSLASAISKKGNLYCFIMMNTINNPIYS